MVKAIVDGQLTEVEIHPQNPWIEDKAYPMVDWRYEVEGGDTLLGYWDWVKNRRESDF